MISKHTAMAFFPVAMCSLLWSAQANQQTFPSAMEAAESLFQAVQSNDVESIAHILGDEKGLTSCDDEVQDRAERELFVRKYKEMHRLHRMGASSMTLTEQQRNSDPLRFLSHWRGRHSDRLL